MSQDLDLVCGDGVVITYPKLVAGLIFPSLATCHVLQAGQNILYCQALAPKPKNPKPRGLRLTLKSHGQPTI